MAANTVKKPLFVEFELLFDYYWIAVVVSSKMLFIDNRKYYSISSLNRAFLS